MMMWTAFRDAAAAPTSPELYISPSSYSSIPSPIYIPTARLFLILYQCLDIVRLKPLYCVSHHHGVQFLQIDTSPCPSLPTLVRSYLTTIRIIRTRHRL